MNNIYNQNDTIAAITTPLGTGGVGIVRISGKKSQEIISGIFSTTLNEKKIPDFKPNRFITGGLFLVVKIKQAVIARSIATRQSKKTK